MRKPKYIKDVEPIEKSAGLDIFSEKDIDEIVELPLRKACKILFRKNIITTSTSANKKDIKPGYAYINLLPIFSKENLIVAKRLVKEGKLIVYKAEGAGGISHAAPVAKIKIPVNEYTTIEEVEKASVEIASKFYKQPFYTFNGRYVYTPEVLREIYCYSDIDLDEFIELAKKDSMFCWEKSPKKLRCYGLKAKVFFFYKPFYELWKKRGFEVVVMSEDLFEKRIEATLNILKRIQRKYD